MQPIPCHGVLVNLTTTIEHVIKHLIYFSSSHRPIYEVDVISEKKYTDTIISYIIYLFEIVLEKVKYYTMLVLSINILKFCKIIFILVNKNQY